MRVTVRNSKGMLTDVEWSDVRGSQKSGFIKFHA